MCAHVPFILHSSFSRGALALRTPLVVDLCSIGALAFISCMPSSSSRNLSRHRRVTGGDSPESSSMSGSESESEGVIRNGKSASLAPSLADPATSGERGNEQVSSFNILKHSLAAEVKSIHEATRTVRHLASFSSALQDTSSVLHVNVLCTWLTRYTHLAPCNTIQ